jgi:uncharacterized protein
MYDGAHGGPMYLPELPLVGREEGFTEASDDPSGIHHFYSKLLKLRDNMNTATAKRMAEKRHEFMVRFLFQFFLEWRQEV